MSLQVTMSLPMTDGEICESYRTAKDQKKQLATLAQLNATDKGTIAAILREGGYKIDGRWLAERKRHEPKAAAPEEDAAPPPHPEELPSSAEVEPEQRPKGPGTISAGEPLLTLGRLPDGAQLLIDGRPFGGIRYTIETAPDGWRETIDLIGGPAHE